jgi:hypothetical protein
MDLPSRPGHRKLPAELNREIYLCFNPANQRKFIYGLGWDFYAMFRYKLLKKVFFFLTYKVNKKSKIWLKCKRQFKVLTASFYS